MNRSNTELKEKAKETLLGCYRQPRFAALLYVLIPTALLTLFEEAGASGTLYYIVAAITIILQTVFSAGLRALHMAMGRSQSYHWRMLYTPFRLADRFFLLAVADAAVTYLPLLPAMILFNIFYVNQNASPEQLILLLVVFAAGLAVSIYCSLSLSLCFFLQLDRPGMSTIDCLKSGFSMIKGHRFQMLLLQLGFVGWWLLGLLSLGVAYLWILPYYYQSLTNFYLELNKEFDVSVSISAEGLRAQQATTHIWGIITDQTPLSTETAAGQTGSAASNAAEVEAQAQQAGFGSFAAAAKGEAPAEVQTESDTSAAFSGGQVTSAAGARTQADGSASPDSIRTLDNPAFFEDES